jgi:succinate--hydroxymethylglutarate CoA-transferase
MCTTLFFPTRLHTPLPQFRLLAQQVLNKPELLDDPKFSSNSARVANRIELEQIISSILQQQPVKYWLQALDGLG